MQESVHMDQGGRDIHHATKERNFHAFQQGEQLSMMPTITTSAKHVEASEERSASTVSLDPTQRYLDVQRAVHAQYVLQLLQLQRRAGFLCDITIQVRDRCFKAHKPLLAACSLYFRSLFANAETMESTALNLNILTPAGFEVLLDYIYSGSLAITAENSSEVLSAATCLQMTNVVETCLSFMRSSFRMCKSADGTNRAVIVDGPDERAAILNRAPPVPAHPQLRPPVKQGLEVPANKRKTSRDRNPSEVVRSPVQDNLQILSSGSINEAEFKSMAIASSPRLPHVHPTGLPNGDSRTPPGAELPTTSQLQSVLPLLLGREARQPTLQEVQQLLSAQHPRQNRMVEAAQASSVMQAADLGKAVSTSTHALTASAPSLNTAPTCISHILPMSGSTMQSGHRPADVAATTCATQCQGEFVPTAPEHYSGASRPAADKPREDTFGEAGDVPDDASMTLSDQGNHLEISDDDDDVECSDRLAWSADRSDDLPTDLSGTPCTASTRSANKPPPSPPGSCPSPPASNQIQPLDLVSKLSQPPSPGKSERTTISSLTSSPAQPALKEIDLGCRAGDAANDRPSSVLRTCSLSSLNSGEVKSSPTQRSSADVINLPTSPISALSSQSNVVTSADYVTASDVDSGSVKMEHLSDEDFDGTPSGFPMQVRSNYSDDVTCTTPSNSSIFFNSPEKASRLSVDECKDQDNDALDLTLPLRSRAHHVSGDSERHLSSCDDNSPRSRRDADSRTQLAVDALALLRQSNPTAQTDVAWSMDSGGVMAATKPPAQNHHDDGIINVAAMDQSNGEPRDVATEQAHGAAFSRKPRRTSGGQTCTWPGCGRLFRHRNIFDEHQRLHELGIPVSQLRKCYMGARVKKTVREQLEELRTNDSTNDNDFDSKTKSRKRKQALTAAQETARKRVTLKDRVGSLQALTSGSSPAASSVSEVTRSVLTQQSSMHHRAAAHPSTAQLRTREGLTTAQLTRTFSSSVMGPVAGQASYTHTQPATGALHPRPSRLTNPTHHSQHPVTVTDAAHSTSSHSSRIVNPVEATLALLGIPTPVRRGDLGPSTGPSVPMGGLSLDQIRRRLALRETSAGRGLFVGAEEVIAGVAPVRPGTVSGRYARPPTYPQTLRGGYPQVSFRAPLPQQHARPQDAAPRPNHYPAPAPTSSSGGQGAQCS